MFKKIPLLQELKKDTWVKPFLKKYKKTLVLAIFLGILTFFCAGALMFNSGYLISRSATRPENILLVYVPIVLTRAFGVGRPVFHYLERLTSHNWVFKMTSDLRVKLYKALEKDAVFFKSKYQLGDVLGLLSEDINHIQNLYLRTIFPTFVAWGLYVFVVIGVGIFSIWMGLLMLLMIGIMLVAFPIWSVIVNGARQEYEKKIKNELYLDLTDNIVGITDWIFAQRGRDYVKLHEQNEEKLMDVQEKLHHFDQIRDYLLQLVFMLVVVSLILWGGTYLGGSNGVYTGLANWIAAFVLCLFPVVDAFAVIPAASQETNVYKDSLVRLNRLQDNSFEEEKSEIKLIAPYDIKLDNVHFRYENSSREILKGINLDISSGDKLAILGRSGSGKSTLANLIRGDRVATEGAITINGIDVSKVGDQISNYIGVIHQTPYLFNTTILNNLRIGNEEATIEQVWQVLERVGLKDMVKALPQGLETMVDEAGMRFSGGERHRMALARILLKDVPIIILDEPTVGLDPLTEQEVISIFNRELKDKTLIWITHHLQGVEAMDQVIFIEDGTIEMQGSPDYLRKTNERYQKLKAIDEGR